jgi:diguanylate cyclase (GGDEF)-like protein/PAS domain S-box-containing protein
MPEPESSALALAPNLTKNHVMDDAPTHVLLIEDDSADARRIEAALAEVGDRAFCVERVGRLSEALARLQQTPVDVVLLDLNLPGNLGIEAFDQVFLAAPNALILVLAESSNEEIARQAVQRGAQDIIAKSSVDAHWLPRALRYVIDRKTTRSALRSSEARFRAISDASPLGIFVADSEGSCTYTNAAYQKISGLTFAETLGTNWSMAIHPEDRQRVLDEWHSAARSQQAFQTEFRFLQKDERVVWTRVNSSAMRDGDTSFGLIQTVEDISERKATEFDLCSSEEALFAEKERAQVTLNSIGDAVLSTDSAGQVMYLNKVAEKMTGWSCDNARGRPLAEVFRVVHGTTRQAVDDPAQQAINEDKTVGMALDSVLIRRDGFEYPIEDSSAPIHNRNGQVAGAVIVFHDVSEARAMAIKMTYLAQHDFLTDLPNRALLKERLSLAIRLAHRHARMVALIFLDLDFFKRVNDSLGHTTGDQLLQSVGNRLVSCVRSTDSVYRQGGDEFVILLTEIEKLPDAALIAEKLIGAFTAPHLVGGHELHVTLSMGISIYPDDSLNAESIMQNADTAMYHAKACGRNNYQFFTPEMNAKAVRRLDVEKSLRQALKQGDFMLHYQPQIDIASGQMSGCEALIRRFDEQSGLVYPAHFVSIAEDCGLIVPIGRWVMREACRQVKTWLDAGLIVVPVSINISALEFRHKDFLAEVSLILEETGLPPCLLELELTESILMHDAESSALLLEALKSLGLKLAIDDFGTGYSSLSYLKRFPIDTLKIDQSFVRDIASDTDGANIVSAVIGMGKNLNQRVIAEGVETDVQLDFLRQQHCAVGQGFLFSPPLPADVFKALLVSMTRCR